MSGHLALPQMPPRAVNLIKNFETLRLDAYRDAVGIPTIGYGHTKGVRCGTSVSPQEAEELLRRDLNEAQASVLRNVKIPLNDNEYGALVSFVFNVGGSAFADSRCLAVLNKGNRMGAVSEMQRFCKGRVNGRKIVLRGLQRRRQAERELFLCPPDMSAAPQGMLALFPPPPTVSRGKKHLTAAAGIGGTVGILPVLADPNRPFTDQLATLWQMLGAPQMPSMPDWLSGEINRLMTLPQATGAREALGHTLMFAQNHATLTFLLGTMTVFMLRNRMLRAIRG